MQLDSDKVFTSLPVRWTDICECDSLNTNPSHLKMLFLQYLIFLYFRKKKVLKSWGWATLLWVPSSMKSQLSFPLCSQPRRAQLDSFISQTLLNLWAPQTRVRRLVWEIELWIELCVEKGQHHYIILLPWSLSEWEVTKGHWFPKSWSVGVQKSTSDFTLLGLWQCLKILLVFFLLLLSTTWDWC